ncbi:hypothetical protein GGR56DRAFT_669096 [Xylariaceae sp. FL0804]|nr:hypothetical protein GGR56DRAFT_669096 [Xylariaceae sp. FL0804]
MVTTSNLQYHHHQHPLHSSDSYHHTEAEQYYYIPNVDMPEHELHGHGWMEPIVIDDDDLMFGGKSLSEWYEEERQTLDFPVEEERRGRQRGASSGAEKKHKE